MISAYVLVVGLLGTHLMSYIPPMADLESCQRVKAAIDDSYIRSHANCIQVFLPAK